MKGQLKRNRRSNHHGLVIILTGAIASGKSYVLSYLKQVGFFTLKSDELTRSAMQDINIINAIASNLPPNIVINQTIDKSALEDYIFSNPELALDRLKFLEAIIHPFIENILRCLINTITIEHRLSVVVEIPLFFESNCKIPYSALLATVADLEIRKARALQRKNMTEKKFDAIVGRQISDYHTKSEIDYFISTNGSRVATIEILKRLIKKDARFKRDRFRYRDNRIKH